MQTKTLFTKKYILLLDGKKVTTNMWSKIKIGDIFYSEIVGDIQMLYSKEVAYDPSGYIILGYVKLDLNAPDLNVPLLSDWEEKIDIEKLAKEEHKFNHKSIDEVSFRLGFEEGYKKEQELSKAKQFTLEDIEKAIDLAREDDYSYSEHEIIRQIQQSKLPKEFIPFFRYYNEKGAVVITKQYCEDCELETIDTPQGKQIVGEWI